MVIIPTSAAQESDVMDVFLNKIDEENVMPEQQTPEEKVDEEIEMEKAVPSPLNNIPADPSGSTKEGEKIEGEQIVYLRYYPYSLLVWCSYPDGS